MKKTILTLLVFVMLVSACSPAPTPVLSTLTPLPTSTPVSTKTSVPIPQPSSTPTIDDLIAIIGASNAELPQSDSTLPRYDTKSPEFAQFPDAVKQLSEMGSEAFVAAPVLAYAIAFPRQDSYLAAQALITLGPDITVNTILTLRDVLLYNQKTEPRIYAAILLGSVGNRASCAVGDIAPLLWDSDPLVRSAVALSLEKITGQDLVSSEYDIVITPSFLANSISADNPEGNIVGVARKWWNEQGSKINWLPSSWDSWCSA